MLTAALISAGFATALAAVLARSSLQSSSREQLIEKVNDLLPQTQCGRCTFAGCKPYATALVEGVADINHCPPGGDATARSLSRLLNRTYKPVDPKFGVTPTQSLVAYIDEETCIGCTKCIQACPVDAIVGASKFMHTVIAAQCTGCELCIPPCPVDCIDLRPTSPLQRIESLVRS
jgi:Na+-translocating ferredoxin:NAD+ oxidoreductase subunit B